MTDDSTPSTSTEFTPIDSDVLTTPGLHEIVAADPDHTARKLADELGGELVRSDDLESTIERRRSGGDSDARLLLERRVAAGPADSVRTVADIDALGAVARGLAKADRILAGTEANMVDTVGQRVSGGGISVHPASIRSAASDLIQVRTEIRKIQQELHDLNESIMDSMIDSGGEAKVEVSDEDDEHRDRGKIGRSAKKRIAGVLLMAFGVAIALGAVLAVVIAPAAAAFVVILPVVACWWAFDTARVDISDLDDKDTASDNLAQISARTDAVFGNVAADEEHTSGGIPASAGAQLQLIESKLELARERERSAGANWSELAGTEADPSDVDRVLRERDPQYFAAIDMVNRTSQARAAAAHLRRVRAQWNLAWAVLGEDPPPPAAAEDAVRELASGGMRGVRINTRIGTEADRELAQQTLDSLTTTEEVRPLVLAGLSEDLSDAVIDSLADLANSTPVVLVSVPNA